MARRKGGIYQRRLIDLQFPVLGLYKRLAIQKQPPYYSVALENVWPDDVSAERERGGTRPALTKSHSTQLGSGNPVRGLDTIVYQDSSFVTKTKLMAISNGTLYKEATSSTMSAVSSSLTLATDRVIQTFNRQNRLFIADTGSTIASGTDGVVSGTPASTFSSASTGSFATAGADADDMTLTITQHAAVNEVQTITLTNATGGTWQARWNGFTTDNLAYNISAANLQTALRALASIDGAYVTVTGSAGGPYTVTFTSILGGYDVELITVSGANLTGTSPTVAVVETTKGCTAYEWAGTWQITTVGSNLTLTKTLRALTGCTFFVERHPKVYRADTDTISLHLTDDDTLGSPKGFVPAGRPLCCLWRDRVVYAGGKHTPHLWEMSRQGDPFDYDYGADPEDTGRAIAGSNSLAGQLGEQITALVPHAHECLIFGCTNSIWIMRGDPAAGGRIDRISPQIGILTADSWCYTPSEYLYFLSHDGIYVMPPGCGAMPQSVSRERLPKELVNIDPSLYEVSMSYDVKKRGIHLQVTLKSAATTTHWWIDNLVTKTGDTTNAQFFPVTYGSTSLDAFVSHSRRNYTSSESWVIFGCRDGYLRRYSDSAISDDGTSFTSYVVYGPIRAGSTDFVSGYVQDVVGTLAQESGDVRVDIYAGETYEEAADFTLTPIATFYWRAESARRTGKSGLQYPVTVRRSCKAFCIKLSNADTNSGFIMEGLRVTVSDGGLLRKG